MLANLRAREKAKFPRIVAIAFSLEPKALFCSVSCGRLQSNCTGRFHSMQGFGASSFEQVAALLLRPSRFEGGHVAGLMRLWSRAMPPKSNIPPQSTARQDSSKERAAQMSLQFVRESTGQRSSKWPPCSPGATSEKDWARYTERPDKSPVARSKALPLEPGIRRRVLGKNSSPFVGRLYGPSFTAAEELLRPRSLSCRSVLQATDLSSASWRRAPSDRRASPYLPSDRFLQNPFWCEVRLP